MDIKDTILKELGALPMELFESSIEIQKRIDFLAHYLKKSKLSGFVLGISGGVDSTTAGKLAQLAVEQLRNEGVDAKFVAVRLPFDKQMDEDDAQEALKFINPDVTHTCNIQAGTNEILSSLPQSLIDRTNAEKIDFSKGNIKARVRMTTQYAIANMCNMLVIGTDHSAEAVMGFYTIHGDGAADILPLSGLNKRQVRALAKDLGAPARLWSKAATADLEELQPHKLDEDALGVPYEHIDDYLEGKSVPINSSQIIESRFSLTAHKRRMPMSFR
ncbi:ammonia-dependent NAD(+) synthetase [Vibrio vulnificus]|nr:ammonia-dependent NAD(+) synthetase [Vibrio vulnificus]